MTMTSSEPSSVLLLSTFHVPCTVYKALVLPNGQNGSMLALDGLTVDGEAGIEPTENFKFYEQP